MYSMSMNLVSGMKRTTGPADIARNIHGDKKFLIKVQLGIDQSTFPPRASRQGTMSIYDETRSFQCALDKSLKSQFEAVFDGVSKHGISNFERMGTHDKLKAYMYAKREGENLRIFTTQFAPQPNW